jgi:hypothetical protein
MGLSLKKCRFYYLRVSSKRLQFAPSGKHPVPVTPKRNVTGDWPSAACSNHQYGESGVEHLKYDSLVKHVPLVKGIAKHVPFTFRCSTPLL